MRNEELGARNHKRWQGPVAVRPLTYRLVTINPHPTTLNNINHQPSTKTPPGAGRPSGTGILKPTSSIKRRALVEVARPGRRM